jgi:hypothetical protein
MASSQRFSHLLFGFSLLAMASFVNEACSVQLSDALASKAGINESDGSFSAGGETTSGGNETSPGVPLPPPPPTDTNFGTTYMDMCGGGCMSGDKSISCALPGNPENPPNTSCQIVPTTDGPVAACATPGVFNEGEPCEKTANCGPSLGCVRMESDVAVCRPYCCGDIEACAPGTYCTLGAMADDTINPTPIQIPVCIPATPCTPLDDTTCPEGRTCTLVRTDGTTSCVVPGPGKQGDACPCAAGHVCVLSSNQCRALCHVGAGDCASGMLCQGGSEDLPDGIGVCVDVK